MGQRHPRLDGGSFSGLRRGEQTKDGAPFFDQGIDGGAVPEGEGPLALAREKGWQLRLGSG